MIEYASTLLYNLSLNVKQTVKLATAEALGDEWARQQVERDPQFFQRWWVNSRRNTFLRCSNQIVGMDPGELFVHRNVANQVIQTDFNCLSVIQFAIEALKVKHVLVVGHYGCGGVQQSNPNLTV